MNWKRRFLDAKAAPSIEGSLRPVQATGDRLWRNFVLGMALMAVGAGFSGFGVGLWLDVWLGTWIWGEPAQPVAATSPLLGIGGFMLGNGTGLVGAALAGRIPYWHRLESGSAVDAVPDVSAP